MILKSTKNGKLELLEKPFLSLVNPSAEKIAENYTAVMGTTVDATDLTSSQLAITGPGEYEQKGVFVFAVRTQKGGETLCYSLEHEGRKVGFIPAWSDLSPECLDHLSGVDVLVVDTDSEDDLGNLKKAIETIDPRVLVFIGKKIEEALKKVGVVLEGSMPEIDTEKLAYNAEKTLVLELA